MVEQNRDMLAFDRPGSDRGVGHGLADAQRAARRFVLVIGLAACAGAGRKVRGAGGAAGTRAVAGERLDVLALLQGHAGLAIAELFLSGLVYVHVGVHQHLRLASTKGLGKHRAETRPHALVIALLGFLHAVAATAATTGGLRPQKLPRGVGNRDLVQLQSGHAGGDQLCDPLHRALWHRCGP